MAYRFSFLEKTGQLGQALSQNAYLDMIIMVIGRA